MLASIQEKPIMTVHIFLSFDNDDRQLVDLFRAQAKSSKSDLEFSDYSIKDEIGSKDESYIKYKIKQQIRKSSIIVCLVGECTHDSDWVEWELETGHDMGKCLVGVRLHSDGGDILPQPLVDYSAKVVNWNIKDIMGAIDGC